MVEDFTFRHKNALRARFRLTGLTTWLGREQPHLTASESMQVSSSTTGRKWAYGTTSAVRMSAWPELRADVLRRPRRARTGAADGRRQQEEVVAHVHDILLALLRDVARPAATRVREVGRRARAAAARRRGGEAMSARAGRRGSGRWAGVARLGCLPRDLNARRLRQSPPNRGSEGYIVAYDGAVVQ